MSRLQGLGQFVWEFVIGDDWRIAAMVVVALGLTAIIAGGGVTAWWLLPVATALVLVISVWRAARASR